MKNTKLFGWALMALAFFSACNNDTEENFTKESEIRLTSEIIPSRVTSLEYQSTQIEVGQEVGVTITGAKSEHNNIVWSVGENGALTNTRDAIYYGDSTAIITAYHPYNSAWSGTSHAFSVCTDQSTNAGYLASDLLWATATSPKTETPVPLTFAHKLAKINVTLTSDDIADLSDATISICGTNISTNFNPTDGTISAATADVKDIKAGVTTFSAYTASAIVVPQTVANGTKFIKVVHGSKTFYYTLAVDKVLKSGYSHNYTLTVKEKELEVATESDKIIDWTDEDGNVGDAEEETISSKSVTLTTAGTLSTFISDEEKKVITSLTITGSLNEEDLAFISDMSGNQGNLKMLDLSNTVVAYNKIRLYGVKLSSLVLPEGIENLYLNCANLSSVNIPYSVKILEIINDTLESINIPEGAEEVDLCNCSKLTSVNIPEGIEYIAYNANHNVVPNGKKWINLAGCKFLSYVSIPNTVTTLGFAAFDGCTNLTYVHIPNNVTTLDAQVFSGCSSLISISIPSGINSIGYYAFQGCNSLKEVHCKNSTPPSVGEYTFYRTPLSTCTLYVPLGSKSKYQSANYWKEFGAIVEE